MKRIVLIAIFWVFTWGQVRAEEHPNVQKARDEIRAVEYKSALDLLRVALESGGNDKNALVDIHRMLADSYVTLGKSEKAKSEYKELLVLEPEVNLGRISPKFLRVFSSAKDELNGDKLMFSHQINTNDRNVVIRVVSDPTGQVVGAKASFMGKNGSLNSVRVQGNNVLTVDLPGDSQSVEIEVVDSNDNSLETFKLGNVTFSNEASKTNGLDTPKEKSSDGGSFITSWWLWAGVAVVAGGTGFLMTSKKNNTEKDQEAYGLANPDAAIDGTPEREEWLNIGDRGRKQALYETISYVTAGTAAAASVFFFIRRNKSNSDKLVGPLVFPEGGGGVTASFRF